MGLQDKLTSKKQPDKSSSYRLAVAPDVLALTNYLDLMMSSQAEAFELIWPAEKQGEFYSLVLNPAGQQGEAIWTLHFGPYVLWEYQSGDVFVIHNMISMACGKHVAQRAGSLATSKVYWKATK